MDIRITASKSRAGSSVAGGGFREPRQSALRPDRLNPQSANLCRSRASGRGEEIAKRPLHQLFRFATTGDINRGPNGGSRSVGRLQSSSGTAFVRGRNNASTASVKDGRTLRTLRSSSRVRKAFVKCPF